MLRAALCLPRPSFRFLFSQMKPISPYKILEIDQTASIDDIKSKYYELAQKYHPDHNPSHVQKFKAVNQAYQVLKDPEKRKQLDEILQSGAVPNFTKMNYSATRQSYGTAYSRATKTKLEQQQLRIKSKYAEGKQYEKANNYFHMGVRLNRNDHQSKSMKSARLKQKEGIIRGALVGCVAIIALFGVVELVFRAYEFNTKGHKNDAEVLARDKMKRKGQITNSTTQQ